MAARYYASPAARARWGRYVDSLPWDDAADGMAVGDGFAATHPLRGADEDPLWHHAAVAARRANDSSRVAPGAIEQLRAAALAMRALLLAVVVSSNDEPVAHELSS